jgi:hypothetical protein
MMPTTGVGQPIELKVPAQATIKAIDGETKLPIGGAAVYADDYPVGITDSRGKLVTSDIPVGKRILSVDAIGYDLAEKEIVIPAPSRMPQKFNYDFELTFIEIPEEVSGAGAATSEAVSSAAEQAAAVTGYEGGAYFGGEYGGGAPTYQAPSYGAPVYNAPSYPAQPTQPTAPSVGAPPLPPIDWLQQFLLLPFTTIQKAFNVPMVAGGQISLFGKPRREILGYCPAGRTASRAARAMTKGGRCH